MAHAELILVLLCVCAAAVAWTFVMLFWSSVELRKMMADSRKVGGRIK